MESIESQLENSDCDKIVDILTQHSVFTSLEILANVFLKLGYLLNQTETNTTPTMDEFILAVMENRPGISNAGADLVKQGLLILAWLDNADQQSQKE